MTQASVVAARGAEPLPYVLALDVGTSSVRALLFDANGMAVPGASAQRAYALTRAEDGEATVDADLLVALLADVLDEVLVAAGPLAARIAAVATDTFWHSLLALDNQGRPLTPVLTWADTRSRAAAKALRGMLDGAAIHARTGCPLHATYWPARLRWLAECHPDVFARAARYLSFGEYLHQVLLGRSVCGLCMASGTGLLRTRAGKWDVELLAILGVRPEQMPALGDLSDAVAGLAAPWAARWPALRSVPWFPALGDGAAANVGSGCMAPERFAVTVGTSAAVRAVVPLEEDCAPAPGLWLYLVDARRGVVGGALSEGGGLLAWMEETLRLPPLPEAGRLAAALPPDGHGLTVLPFLAGERSPGWHDAARAAIVGIHAATTPIELYRAGVEALAYRIAAVSERLMRMLGLDSPAITSVGSGTALLSSPLLQQVIADTLGVPLYLSGAYDASARGAALLALEALGVAPADAGATPPESSTPVVPDAARGAIYRRAAARQRQLYHTLLDESAV